MAFKNNEVRSKVTDISNRTLFSARLTPEEHAEHIQDRLMDFLKAAPKSREIHGVSGKVHPVAEDVVIQFRLGDPATPHMDLTHIAFLSLLGIEEPELPGPEEDYDNGGKEEVYTDSFGKILRQVINLAEDPHYAECSASHLVFYRAHRTLGETAIHEFREGEIAAMLQQSGAPASTAHSAE